MRRYSIAEAREKFDEMLEHVRAGETVVVTENGRAVAEVGAGSAERKSLVERLQKEFASIRSEGRAVTADEISAWRDEGLR